MLWPAGLKWPLWQIHMAIWITISFANGKMATLATIHRAIWQVNRLSFDICLCMKFHKMALYMNCANFYEQDCKMGFYEFLQTYLLYVWIQEFELTGFEFRYFKSFIIYNKNPGLLLNGCSRTGSNLSYIYFRKINHQRGSWLQAQAKSRATASISYSLDRRRNPSF